MTNDIIDEEPCLEEHPNIIARFNPKSCMITTLFIPALLRGQGRGTAELQRMENTLRKAGCTTAQVFVAPIPPCSVPASEFYRKNGYLHSYPNFGNWMTQAVGWPKCGQPQPGLMYKPL